MVNVHVTQQENNVFEVVVEERESKTTHTVTLYPEDYERLTKKSCTEKELIKRSFLFLLQRESKEMILKHFDLMEIAQYFPEYEEKITC